MKDAIIKMEDWLKVDIGSTSTTAYGAKFKPKIPANSDLIFNEEDARAEID